MSSKVANKVAKTNIERHSFVERKRVLSYSKKKLQK